MDRSSFIGTIIPSTIAVATISSLHPTNAIEFVPASPFFSGTYQDALEIMHAQRIAVDNIANVIQDGKIEEAGFKVMQLNAQTRTAWKIILDITNNKYLKRNTLKGKLGATAAAQIKSSKVVDETKSAYDDFLMDAKTLEKELDMLRGM
eukprot:scaffold1046_cov136-Skeletonema_dohrnii-CCMP3373.AAC.1